MIYYFVCIAISIIASYIILKSVKKIYKSSRVDAMYTLDKEKFKIRGRKNKFIISKNDNIEFLVSNGRIIACRDLRINKEFKYYER